MQLLQSIYDLQLEEQKEIRQTLDNLRREQIVQSAQLRDTIEQSVPRQSLSRVAIGDFDMPFWAIVGFLIKFSLASIPAAILLTILAVIILLVLASFGVRLY